jgi:hypothetical protein
MTIGAALLPSLAGWQVMNKTAAAEKARFVKQPEVAREIEYFKANIGKIETPADLVKDRRLLAVALEAFGLGGDVNAQGRVRKVLEEGTIDPKALANKLIDPRYKEMSGAFAFDMLGNQRLKDKEFVQSVIDRYQTAKFEAEVGEDNDALRNAMYFKRKIGGVTNWYNVLADKALFAVVKTGLGLPDDFSKIDVDRQADILESKVKLATFKDPAKLDQFATRYLAVNSALESQNTITSPALQILSSMNGGGGRSFGLATDTLTALLSVQGARY